MCVQPVWFLPSLAGRLVLCPKSCLCLCLFPFLLSFCCLPQTFLQHEPMCICFVDHDEGQCSGDVDVAFVLGANLLVDHGGRGTKTSSLEGTPGESGLLVLPQVEMSRHWHHLSCVLGHFGQLPHLLPGQMLQRPQCDTKCMSGPVASCDT